MAAPSTAMTLHGLDLDLSGWFQIGWSDELGPGEVLAKRYFGRDLVVYRGTDGIVRVHDRYCQHLGASLAHGGRVVDGGIQCPFHGWIWGTDGANVSIPYQDRPNRARRVTAWPVAELNESIYIWNDPAGEPPKWELVDALTLAPHAAARSFHPAGPDGRSHFTELQVHPQMVVENAVDPHHFRFVHRTPISPVVLEEVITDAQWWVRVGFGRRWVDHVAAGNAPSAESQNTIEIRWQGMGVSVNTEHLREGIRVVAINITPVEDGRSEIFATYWIDEHPGDLADGSFERRRGEAMTAMPDDLEIWNHQIFLDPPALATSEAKGFRAMRRWTQQFFPPNSEYTLRSRVGAG
jgi:3-ketosteroid 9alpha-monooxygenase subunit A